MASSLILASTSPARRALLDGLQLPYSVESPGVDEDVPPGTLVEDAVRMLAARKAKAVFARHPHAFVLGADQLVSANGRALGKPANRDAARAQLQELAAAPHELVTGVCLLGPSFDSTLVERTRLTLYPFRGEELEHYLDTREWEGCAGGYRVEARGQWLMERIEGDRTNIQGLPMLSVVKLLRAAGFPGPGTR